MTQKLKSRLRRLQAGFSMIEMLVVILIISVLLAITVGAISAFQRFQYDRQTRQELATLDAVVDEYYTVKGKYPNIYGTPQALSTTVATSGIAPVSLAVNASAKHFYSTFLLNTSGGSTVSYTASFDEPYAMSYFLAQVEGVGNIGYTGMLDASGVPSTTSAVPQTGMLSQLYNFTTLNMLTTGSLAISYKNLSYTMSYSDQNSTTIPGPNTLNLLNSAVTPIGLPGMVLLRDGWDRYIWYGPPTIETGSGAAGADPTAKRPRFGSLGGDSYYTITTSQLNSANTYSAGRDDIISSGGANQ